MHVLQLWRSAALISFLLNRYHLYDCADRVVQTVRNADPWYFGTYLTRKGCHFYTSIKCVYDRQLIQFGTTHPALWWCRRKVQKEWKTAVVRQYEQCEVQLCHIAVVFTFVALEMCFMCIEHNIRTCINYSLKKGGLWETWLQSKALWQFLDRCPELRVLKDFLDHAKLWDDSFVPSLVYATFRTG